MESALKPVVLTSSLGEPEERSLMVIEMNPRVAFFGAGVESRLPSAKVAAKLAGLPSTSR